MTVFVSNFPYSVEDDQLRAAIERYGNYTSILSARIVRNRETQKSRGFAFVEFSDAAEGQHAIENLNGATWLGRDLRINEARPRGEAPARLPGRVA